MGSEVKIGEKATSRRGVTANQADWLLQMVPPDVDMAQGGRDFHGCSQRQKTLCADVVVAH